MVYQNGKAIAATNNIGSPNEVYSTEERVIGTWIDGKPLYQRILRGRSGTTHSNWVSIGSLGADCQPVMYTGWMLEGYDNILALPYSISTGGAIGIIANIAGNHDVLVDVFANIPAYLDKPVYVLVKYTKTTDRATIELPAILSGIPITADYDPMSLASITFENMRNEDGWS